MKATISLTDLTNGRLDKEDEWIGTGVLDKLIHTVNKNIEAQYNKGRITGAEYAEVYLGSVQSVIQQSMQFVLQEQRVEAEIDLLRKQTEKADKDTAYVTAQIAHLAKENQKIDAEITNLVIQGTVLQSQKTKLDQEALGVDANTTLTNAKKQEQDIKNGGGIVARSVPYNQVEVLKSQKELYDRQKQGFDDHKYQKLFESQLNSYSMMFGDMMGSSVKVPDAITNPETTATYNKLK